MPDLNDEIKAMNATMRLQHVVRQETERLILTDAFAHAVAHVLRQLQRTTAEDRDALLDAVSVVIQLANAVRAPEPPRPHLTPPKVYRGVDDRSH